MTVSAVTKGRPAVSAMEKSVITTPSSRLPPMPPMRTSPCTISWRVLSVNRRTRSRPKSVMVTSSTPTTVSTASAPMTRPRPMRTRFMSEGLPDGEVKRQAIEDLTPSLFRVLQRVIRLSLLEGDNDARAVVVDHFGDDRQILGQAGLDAEIDANGPDGRGVAKAESRRDRARAPRERRDVALAHDPRIDEDGHVERLPESEAILDAPFEERAAPDRARLEVARKQARGCFAVAPDQQIITRARRGRGVVRCVEQLSRIDREHPRAKLVLPVTADRLGTARVEALPRMENGVGGGGVRTEERLRSAPQRAHPPAANAPRQDRMAAERLVVPVFSREAIVAIVRHRECRRMLEVGAREVAARRVERIISTVGDERECEGGELLPGPQRRDVGGIADAEVLAEIDIARLDPRQLEPIREARRRTRCQRSRERRARAKSLLHENGRGAAAVRKGAQP